MKLIALFIAAFTLANAQTASQVAQTALQIANDSATGTKPNRLAVLTSTGQVVSAATTDTTSIVGIVTQGAGKTGMAFIPQAGFAACDFDGPTTAKDYVIASTTAASLCHDAGSSQPVSVSIIGRVVATGSTSVFVFPVGAAAISGGAANSAGNIGQVQVAGPSGSFGAVDAKLSNFTNDLGFQTSPQVNAAIAALNLGTAANHPATDFDAAGTAATQAAAAQAAAIAASDTNGAAAGAQTAAIAASAQKASNLGDLANSAAARTNLGLGSLATQSAPNSAVLGSTSGGAPVDITRAVGQSSGKSYLVDYRSVKDVQFAGGATGDGTTNDQAALQAAFTAGGTIHIPPGGVYLHSSSLTVGANTNIVCDGGLGSSAILRGTNSTPGVYANAVNFNGANNSSISGCNIDSLATSRQPQVLAAGIYIGGGTNVRATGNNIGTTWGPGIYVASLNATGGTAGATKFLVDSNILNGNFSNGIIIRSSPTNGTVTNNQIYNCGDGGIEVSSAIGDLNPTSDILVQNNLISGCVVGLNSAGGLRIHFKENTIINPTTQGITIYKDVGFQTPVDDDVVGNHVSGATNVSYNSIAISSLVGGTIDQNIISNGTGVSVASTNAASNLSLKHNHLYNITAGNGFTISGNVAGLDLVDNTVNGVINGTCASINNTTAAVSDLMISQMHCSNINVGNAGVGIIDVVGSVSVGGTGNFVGGTNTTNSGAIRLAGGATTAASFNIGTIATLDQVSSPAAAVAWVFPDIGLAITGTAPGSVAGSGTDALAILGVTGTPGGATSGTTGQTAGHGAGVTIVAGVGGAAPSGSTNGNGGALVLGGGLPGSGSGTPGVRGPTFLQPSGGQVAIGTNTLKVVAGSYSALYVTSPGVSLEADRVSGAGVIQLDNAGTAEAQVTALSTGGGALKNASGSAIAHEWDSAGNNFFGTAQQTEIAASGQFEITPIATSALPTCTASTGKPWRGSVNDATAPAVGSALTGGGTVFANVHCSLTTGTYLVDGL